MFIYFRQLRRKFIHARKLRKYLFYAIGEILLVIIGLFIALQIDSYKEQADKEEQVQLLLKEIHGNLAQDVQETSVIIADLEYQDSIITKILSRDVEIAQIEKWLSMDFRKPGQFYSDFQVTDIGYQNLTARLPELPSKYFKLVGELDHFYGEMTNLIQNQMKLLTELSLNYEKEVSSTYGWYWEASEGISFEEGISFYQTESLFWNTLALFKKKVRVLLFDLRLLQEEAILNSLRIAEEAGPLKTVIPKGMKSPTYKISSNFKSKLKGAYRMNISGMEETFHVSFLQDFMIFRFSDNSVTMFVARDKDFFQGVSSETNIKVRKNEKMAYEVCVVNGKNMLCGEKIEGHEF